MNTEKSEIITTLLHRLTQGDYTAHFEGDDELSSALHSLINALKTRAMEDLDQVVRLSIEVNETAILSANLLYNLRQTNEQAHSIAAASEEMTATVGSIGTYGQNISQQAKLAQDATHSGAQASEEAKRRMTQITASVSETSKRVDNLNQLSHTINGILEAIRKIASQTNLLALNATIEAARAGEAGRGFAVVASEVKHLSKQTAEATEQIATIITQLQQEMAAILSSMQESSNAVRSGEECIDDLAQKISLIRTQIDDVSQNTANISETLSQQAEAATEVAKGIIAIAQSSTQSVSGTDRIVQAMNKVEAMITRQIAKLALLEVPGKVVKLAQSDHVLWKKRLANMLAGHEGLNPNELSNHHSCRLGKWYDAQQDTRYTGHAHFKQLLTPHQHVHEAGIEAVRHFNAGNTQQALDEIAKVEAASKEVLHHLSQLESVEA